MKIDELDVVKLKDGREGIVMGAWSDGEAYEIEFDYSENSDVRTVKHSEIERVVKKAPE